MVFVIILVILIIFVVLIRKRTTAKKLSEPVPVCSIIDSSTLFGIFSYEDWLEKEKAFNEIMLRPEGEQLTKCYNEIRKLFIPTKKDGTYEGSLIGALDVSQRAKSLEKIDRTVFPILEKNQEEYDLWYTVVYDRIFKEQKTSDNKKLHRAAETVYQDVLAGDTELRESMFLDMLDEHVEREVEIETRNARKVKIKFKIGKDSKMTYTIKKLYRWFPEGLNMEDHLIHAAEMLIGISAFSEYPKGCTIFKSTIEKYELPHIRS